MVDFAQVVLGGGSAGGWGACFPDAGPGSNATTLVRHNAVKPTGRLSRAAADVARETFRSTFSPACAEKSTGTSKRKVKLIRKRWSDENPDLTT